jgi:uncharacterized membrane protein
MTLLRRYRVAFAFILLAFVVTALVYGQLPDRIPTDWDWNGRPAGYVAKWWGAWIMPGVAGLTTAAMANLFSVKRSSTVIITAFAGLMLFICASIGYWMIHTANAPVAYLFAGIGVFLIVVGNIVGKLTWNYFVGIRTFWTLDDPVVWERTHRAAGPVFVVGGLAMVCAGVAHAPVSMLMALLVATFLYPVIYSYWVWRRA